MISRVLSLIALVLMGLVVVPLVLLEPAEELKPLAAHYVEKGPDELGAANLVTSVIVTYRGLDTLGEVAVLFIATCGVGILLGKMKGRDEEYRKASEILEAGAGFLFPVILLLGAYIFIHGHLTPGGGFQGGVVIATAFLLLMLSGHIKKLNHLVMNLVESFSGVLYITIGILGLVLAGGFLDNRFLELGTLGSLMSAGAIPIIYTLIGLKVGAELTSILENMSGGEEA